jgi:hypothetical protein
MTVHGPNGAAKYKVSYNLTNLSVLPETILLAVGEFVFLTNKTL